MQGPACIVRLAPVTADTGTYTPSMAGYRCAELPGH